jgi:hypothetical protein
MTQNRGLTSSIILLLVRIIILTAINVVLIELPMLKDISIPGLPLTIQSIISFVIGLIMIIVLVAFQRDFMNKMHSDYPAFPEVRTFISYALSLIIILVAYTMFDGAIRPLMPKYSWVYPVFFLVIALWPICKLVFMLVRNSRSIANWLSYKFGGEAVTEMKKNKCLACGEPTPYSAKYCPACGVLIASPGQNNIKCIVCGTVSKCTSRYCMNCGTSLNGDEQYETRVSV